jgi:hypothetical protein
MNGKALLTGFEKSRQALRSVINKNVDDLYNILWTKNSIFWYDRDCPCQMKDKSTDFMCSACRTFSRLTDINPKKDSFSILCGNSDIRIGIERFPILDLHFSKTCGPIIRIKKLIMNNPDLSDLKSLENTEFLETDPFTARLLIGVLLNSIMTETKILAPKTLTGFVCANTGYILKESADSMEEYTLSIKQHLETNKDNILHYSGEDSKTVLFSLLATLNGFSKVGLTLGKPSLSSIHVIEDHTEYKLDDKTLDLPVVFTLGLTEFSSITATTNDKCKLRIYANTLYIEKMLDKILSSPAIETALINTQLSNVTPSRLVGTIAVLTYTITSENKELFLALRYNGIPLFGNSFDLYCIFFSLMCYLPFYLGAQSSHVHKMWKELWIDEDYDIIESRIKNYHGKPAPSFDQIVAQFYNIKLRTDILSVLYAMMLKQL